MVSYGRHLQNVVDIMKNESTNNIKQLVMCTELESISERALMVLWAEFSEIQYATCITFDSYSLERFIEWVKTGDDEKAWS